MYHLHFENTVNFKLLCSPVVYWHGLHDLQIVVHWIIWFSSHEWGVQEGRGIVLEKQSKAKGTFRVYSEQRDYFYHGGERHWTLPGAKVWLGIISYISWFTFLFCCVSLCCLHITRMYSDAISNSLERRSRNRHNRLSRPMKFGAEVLSYFVYLVFLLWWQVT